jgi:DNA-binding transcriptional LysR family regulator
MLEIRELFHLICIDDQRHFGRAAKAAGISQSAITKSLQRAERSLGVTLFERSRSGVKPTVVGEEVLVRARRLVADVRDLRQAVVQMEDPHAGQVSVGVGPAMSESIVDRAVGELIRNRARTKVYIRVENWQQLTCWLLAGEIDFFVADVTDARRDERFEFIDLPPLDLVWFCRKGHPLARSRKNWPVSRGALLKHPFATPKMPLWAIEWFRQYFSDGMDKELPEPFPAVECESYAMLKRIVSFTDCVSAALAPTIQDGLDTKSFVSLPVDGPGLTTRAAIVRLAGTSPLPAAAQLIDSVVRLSGD